MHNSCHYTLILTLITCISLTITKPTCANIELRALMAIKSSLDPENKLLPSWTSDGDPCGGAFDGVACNKERKVTNITLQGKSLAGKVSPALAELKRLSGLYLHYNSLRGEIPKEIANLTELTDLYLNVNNFSGSIPTEIRSMANLQVMQLSCNQLTGNIPREIGMLKMLSVVTLDSNRLTGRIPESLGNLMMLKRLCLSFNQLSGPIPLTLANLQRLEVLYLQNNSLSGLVPSALKRLKGRFQFSNNPGLCGTSFSSLRHCTSWDNLNINNPISSPDISISNTTAKNYNISAALPPACNQTHCSMSSSTLRKICIVAGVTTLAITLLLTAFAGIVRNRRYKHKVENQSDISDDGYKRNPSALTPFESSNWCSVEFMFNMEEVELATQYFSESNLLGKSKFCAVYKGILKDGSFVAVKSIRKASCKIEENELIKGLSLLSSLKHENLVNLRGFCWSKARGECFLIYDFVSKGNLSQYLANDEDYSGVVLDWPTRVSIIKGIAKGIAYLHSTEKTKPAIIHRNISVEKILIDQHSKPLILDSGLLRLLADDVVYSAIKASAALGYMAPEYITTGRFTEKSDIYAFGVIIFQLLSGKTKLPSSIRNSAELGKLADFIDSKLEGQFSDIEADQLSRIALDCTQDLPEKRLNIVSVI